MIVFTIFRLIWNSERIVSACFSKSIEKLYIQSDFCFDLIRRFGKVSLCVPDKELCNQRGIHTAIRRIVSRGVSVSRHHVGPSKTPLAYVSLGYGTVRFKGAPNLQGDLRMP